MIKAFTGYQMGMLDYHNRMALTLFFNGCNLRCPFCHNMGVVLGEAEISVSEAWDILKQRNQPFGSMKLGVVLSGGEPTIHPEFNEAVRWFKDHPLGIHTNGLVLPSMQKNVFDSVVLSLKPQSLIPDGLNYSHLFAQALRYYSSAQDHREVRIVDFPKYKQEYQYLLSTLPTDCLAGWEVKWVKPNIPKE